MDCRKEDEKITERVIYGMIKQIIILDLMIVVNMHDNRKRVAIPSNNRCLWSSEILAVARRAKSFSVLYFSYKTSFVRIFSS